MKIEHIGLYAGYGLYLDGVWRPAASGAVRAVIDPTNEEVIGTIPMAGPQDMDAALTVAQRAFARWRQVNPWERAAILRRVAQLIHERQADIARLMSAETGKPLAEAKSEVAAAAEQFEWYAEETKRIYGHTIEGRSPDVRMQVRYEPVGVVAAFTAWNFPALLPARKMAAALAAGCTVIVKPASEAPGSCMALVAACHDAGVPAGVVSLITGDSGAISEYLIASPIVRKISLTGSVPVGKRLLAQCADGLKKASMELGGHAPVLVFEDADPVVAARTAARTKFRNCGQVCISPSRFFVHESIYAPFCEAFAEVAQGLRIGPGLDEQSEVGPLANRRGLIAAETLVADALGRGARLLAGGARPPDFDRGYYFQPTVLADVPDEARVMHDEPFGPVAPIAAFRDFDEAITRANGLPFGLAAYVFTSSLKTSALAAEALEAGMVGVNEMLLASAEIPFGGVKESGIGREGGMLGLRDYLEPKFIKTRLA